MSTWRDVPDQLRSHLRGLKYTEPLSILLEVPVNDGTLLVIGDPADGAYEWVEVDEQSRPIKHSDAGYGVCEIALRDGLCAALGMPEITATYRLGQRIAPPTMSVAASTWFCTEPDSRGLAVPQPRRSPQPGEKP